MKGLSASTHRKLTHRDNIIDAVIRDYAALNGIKLSDDLPPLPTQEDMLKRAGGRTVKA